MSPREAVEILLAPLQEGKFCKTTPRAIQHNVTFLVDRTHLKHEDDIKSDDMGAWRNNGVHKYRFPLDEKGDLYQLDDDDVPATEWVMYNLKRFYYKNKSSPDLNKYFYVIPGKYDTSRIAKRAQVKKGRWTVLARPGSY